MNEHSIRRMNKYKSLLCMGALLLLAACHGDRPDLESEGVMLSLSIRDVSQGVETRAVPAELEQPMTEAFRLQVKSHEARPGYEGPFLSSVGPFYPGPYTITVSCGENIVALDAPYYEGRTDAQVVKGFKNVIHIDARVANALLSVRYDDVSAETMDKTFTSHAIAVSTQGTTLNLQGSHPSESAYFPANSALRVVFKAQKAGGENVEKDLTSQLSHLLPLAAGQHLKLRMGLRADAIDILKAEVEQADIAETILNRWLPKPKTVAQGFDAQGMLQLAETQTAETVSISYTSTKPTEEMELIVQMEDENFTSINGTYLLSRMTLDERRQLENAGIRVPQLGTTQGVLDLSDLAGSLRTNAGAETQNQVGIRVLANDRWSNITPEMFTIRVVKPEFTLPEAWPGKIWTREFTIQPIDVQSGSEGVLRSSVSYQYRLLGSQQWNAFPKDLRMAGLPAATTYELKAVYREGIESNVIRVRTYPQTPLENGNLDGPYTETGSDVENFTAVSTGHGRRFVFQGWATLNELTTDDTNGANYVYTSRSATRPTDDAVSGRAIWLGTIGWGYGGTTLGGAAYTTPGELYKGTLENVDHGADTATKNYGISYASRPTALTFYYKYTAFKTDQAIARVQVMHDDIVLGEARATYATRTSYLQTTLEIDYDQAEEKLRLAPNKLVVAFASGSLLETEFTQTSSFLGAPTNGYYTGSQLWLDEIALVYGK